MCRNVGFTVAGRNYNLAGLHAELGARGQNEIFQNLRGQWYEVVETVYINFPKV